jgi:hypothetical protein
MADLEKLTQTTGNTPPPNEVKNQTAHANIVNPNTFSSTQISVARL